MADGPGALDERLLRRALHVVGRNRRELVVPVADRWRGTGREQAAEAIRAPGDRVARESDAREQAAPDARELGIADRLVGQALQLDEQRVLDRAMRDTRPDRRLEQEKERILVYAEARGGLRPELLLHQPAAEPRPAAPRRVPAAATRAPARQPPQLPP